jgi:hypothetical protein
MPLRRRLVIAISLSALLHAAVFYFLAIIPDHSLKPALTSEGSRTRGTITNVLPVRPLGITKTPHSHSIDGRSPVTDAFRTDIERYATGITNPEARTSRTAHAPDTFLPQEYLTRQPRPESELSLEDIPQPEQAGVFHMRIWIDRRGKPLYIETEDTAAPVEFVEQIAERFKAARFIPGERHGLPVACIIRIEISY